MSGVAAISHQRSPISRAQTSRERQTEQDGVPVVRVALLGCGVVGSEVANLLIDHRRRIAERNAVDVRIERILVRHPQRDRGIDRQLFTDRFEDVARSDVDVVIEALGGLDPAHEYVKRLLAAGVNVISANKTLIAHHGDELRRIAAENGTHLAFEASVCAAVPVLAALERLRGDTVRSITGIVNGACNFILTRLAETEITLEEATAEARRRGLVEPDPSADLSGRDSAEKLCILAGLAGIGGISPAAVSVRGIDNLTRRDLLAAKRLGCVIKLIASASWSEGQIAAKVGPSLIPEDHPLARVKDENNAVLIDCEFGGELLLQGKGAGPRPTAAAILGDLLHIDSGSRSRRAAFNHAGSQHVPSSAIAQEFYLRIVPDNRHQRPEQVLTALAAHSIPIAEIEFTADGVCILTRGVSSASIDAAVRTIAGERFDRCFLAGLVRKSPHAEANDGQERAAALAA